MCTSEPFLVILCDTITIILYSVSIPTSYSRYKFPKLSIVGTSGGRSINALMKLMWLILLNEFVNKITSLTYLPMCSTRTNDLVCIHFVSQELYFSNSGYSNPIARSYTISVDFYRKISGPRIPQFQ